MSFGSSKSYKKLPTSNGILEHVSDLEIFEFYLGDLPRKVISSPLRDDTKPSFSLFHSKVNGIIMFKDFATGESGDCFLFVMKLLKLSSKIDCFNRIAVDMGLLDHFDINDSYVSSPRKKFVPSKSNKKDFIKDKIQIRVTLRAWKIKDKNYWDKRYGLNKAQLEYCNVFPISHYFINGYCTKVIGLGYAFVEEKDGVQTFKIYQPFSDDKKWINNNDYSTWELWTQLPEIGKILIVTSSRKDAMVIKSLFPSDQITSCSLQSEGVNPKDGVVDELKNRFEHIFVMYDNDFNSKKNRGRIAGNKIASSTGFMQIEIPDGCEVKDPSDYIEKFDKESLKNLILRLIRKNIK